MLDCPEEILYNPRSAGPLAQWLEQATHNRLVAGSSPAGATKFSDVNHAFKPRFKVAFLFSQSVIGSKMAADFFYPSKYNHLPNKLNILLAHFCWKKNQLR